MVRRAGRVLAAAVVVASLLTSGCGVRIKGINGWDMTSPEDVRQAYSKVLERAGADVAYAAVWEQGVTAIAAKGRQWSFHDGEVDKAPASDLPLGNIMGPTFPARSIDLGAQLARCRELARDWSVQVLPGPRPETPYVDLACAGDRRSTWYRGDEVVPPRDVLTRDGFLAAWADLQGQGDRLLRVSMDSEELSLVSVGRCQTRFCPWAAKQGTRGMKMTTSSSPDDNTPFPASVLDPEVLWTVIERFLGNYPTARSSLLVSVDHKRDKDVVELFVTGAGNSCRYDTSGVLLGKRDSTTC